MSESSSAFNLLDKRIQHFIWSEGWSELRDAQEKAIPLIIKADRDVIVAAATAAGKTEAAFFPALTHLLENSNEGLIVYISPLKALINDQFGRLDRLCESLEIPVWPWHGDVAASKKTKFLAKRVGVLLITPESLEALLCNRGSSVGAVFKKTTFFVIDELHAFIGSERGKQLQSLMHRIECSIGRSIPRIGLSATLGDMRLAADFLRPGKSAEVEMVISSTDGVALKILVKGYEEPLVVQVKNDREEPESITPSQVGANLFKALRGSNNLVFPNSRRQVELYTHVLNAMCELNKVPNEFWPHHGSLSKEIRYETESALKQKEYPATAICTNTLELGIDIGAVKSVAQIGCAPTVASLRQRLGRSGRRKGEDAILRGYCIEHALDVNSSLHAKLRLDTVQLAAQITLLLDNWFEPPRVQGMHLSTLIQQLLSSIAQIGGASASQLYSLLCAADTPFSRVSKAEFLELLKHLGEKELIMQDSSGALLHGSVGEKFVNHYSFYAAFSADEEFRMVAGGKALGTIPVSQMMTAGQRILFAGKTWRVDEIDESQKTIYVSRTTSGVPPLFSGGGGRTHTNVRQRMRQILESKLVPAFLDKTAARFLEEARDCYQHMNLAKQVVLDQGSEVLLLTWLGDSANEAIACMFIRQGLVATPAGIGVEVRKSGHSVDEVLAVLQDAAHSEIPPLDLLLENVQNLQREKWDWALPDGLLRKAYASHNLNLQEGLEWVSTLRKN
jgi:ATP-dependent helicase Lhr and Lhr-like helicase